MGIAWAARVVIRHPASQSRDNRADPTCTGQVVATPWPTAPASEVAWALNIDRTKRHQENEMEKNIATDGLTAAFLVAMLGRLCCVFTK